MNKPRDIYEAVSDKNFLEYFSSLTLKAREKVCKVLDEAREEVPEELSKSTESPQQHPKQVAKIQSAIPDELYRG